MFNSIQTVGHASGNQAPRSASAPLPADAAASEDGTAISDEFAVLIAALMPASLTPLSGPVQNDSEAENLHIADPKEATLPGPDAAKATLGPASTGALERVARPERNAPATGSVASDRLDLSFTAPTAAHVPGSSVDPGGRDPGPSTPSASDSRSMNPGRAPSDVSVADGAVPRTAVDQQPSSRQGPDTTATSAAGVASQPTIEAITDDLTAAQVPSLPGDEGEPRLRLIANLGAVEQMTTFRKLPPDPPMRPTAPSSRSDSVAEPDDPNTETSSFAPAPSIDPSETPRSEQEISAAARISDEAKGENQVGHGARPTETPGPNEPADTVRTFPGTMVPDPSPDTALTAGPGSGSLTAPQGSPPVGNAHGLPEIPAEIVRQNIEHIAGATRQLDRGTIEITLSPEELGHVRLTVKSHDITGTTVVLQADRPETLDLMRRHIDLLAQDMREFGYRELTFAFQDRRPGDREVPAAGRDTDDSTGGSSALGKVPSGTMTEALRPSIQDGRLDIRI